MKKAIAILLTLAMVLGVSSVALASPINRNGNANINFTEGSAGPIDPTDPLVPGTWVLDANLNLDFGNQQVSATTQTYESQGTGTTYAAYAVNSGSLGGWTVTAQLGAFTTGTTPTMQDAELELINNKNERTVDASTSTVEEPTLTAGGGAQTIYTGSGVGVFGAQWRGELTVIAGSVAVLGLANATMTWSFVAA